MMPDPATAAAREIMSLWDDTKASLPEERIVLLIAACIIRHFPPHPDAPLPAEVAKLLERLDGLYAATRRGGSFMSQWEADHEFNNAMHRSYLTLAASLRSAWSEVEQWKKKLMQNQELAIHKALDEQAAGLKEVHDAELTRLRGMLKNSWPAAWTDESINAALKEQEGTT
jgi:hypothetical protein